MFIAWATFFTVVLSLSLFAAAAQTADSYHIVKRIPVPGQGSWDYLTVDEGARRLYVSHGTQVEVLDIDSGAIVGKIEKTPGVHGIAIAPELGRGFVSNGQSSSVTIFDLKTLKTITEFQWARSPTPSSMIPPVRACSPSTATATARLRAVDAAAIWEASAQAEDGSPGCATFCG